MRFRDTVRELARELNRSSSEVEFIVEGWLQLVGRKLVAGHRIGTPIAILGTKRAHALRRASRGHRRDLAIKPTREFRAALDRVLGVELSAKRKTRRGGGGADG